MKFVTWESNGKEISGVLTEDFVISFKDMLGYDVSLTEFITKNISLDLIKEKMNNSPKEELKNVKLLSPIPYPIRNVICIGKNYQDHINELKNFTGTALTPDKPIYFTKSAYPALGPDGFINLDPTVTEKLDYEVELCVIIGKKGKKIKTEDVYNYIFGYSILNDISARDIQKNHVQWFLGKSIDTGCPIGPWIVPKENLKFPLNLNIEARVNGEVRQKSNTSNMIFDVSEIVSQISKTMTLYPGDIIATGTPSGVGQGFDPPKYLQTGDVIECEIESIGILRNTVS